ncbi:putative ribosomal protein L20 [Cardiosporidium cionae]|uniref:Ribosomal protein L20 n=1 Tax=Cardiosporidium cionae TaxID=476202 RepID=A0ABQ7JAR9_9APIC|nr:putative ribosomal protein L20 [Cardiosporidium cionae]|eukprot:KAF8821096.1 putative ribosomal protein L20 [Cardiosporidium cionae]
MRLPRQVVFQVAKGFRGRSKGCIKLAVVKGMHSLFRSYIMRQQRARRYRIYWITRINAACREWSLPYSWFIGSLWRQRIDLNRKMLATLAETEPISYKCLVDEAKRFHTRTPSKVRDTSEL